LGKGVRYNKTGTGTVEAARGSNRKGFEKGKGIGAIPLNPSSRGETCSKE